MTEVCTSPVQQTLTSPTLCRQSSDQSDSSTSKQSDKNKAGRKTKRKPSNEGTPVGGQHAQPRSAKQPRRESRGRRDMPIPFLLGGTRKDPLNLGGILGPVTGTTPRTSPPEVEIVVPKNTRDPLNLKAQARQRKRKRRESLRADQKDLSDAKPSSPTSYSDSELAGVDGLLGPARKVARTNTMSEGQSRHQLREKIVSPVPRPVSQKRHSASPAKKDPTPTTISSDEPTSPLLPNKTDKKPVDRFRYGNFNRYYGKRLKEKEEDPRFKLINREFIEDKSVLDIGCNVGFLTLKMAKDMAPRRITGVDIDGQLVGIARKNIRHYCDDSIEMTGKFPASFSRQFGPVSAPPINPTQKFPNNVWFHQENYVLATDDMLDQVSPLYDTVLALSVTKWVHLNWGDAGLKRFFRRIFRHLFPGGHLILEPQQFSTYRKRSKMTPEMNQHYKAILLKPDQFRDFLVKDVGFVACDAREVTNAHAKGFQRPILVFMKPKVERSGSSTAATASRKTISSSTSDVPTPVATHTGDSECRS
uniref:RNA methyltransferase n=1 Tax=Plectus sambesii TaxID=2011161 RepID=A0A914VUR5_9BILA